MGFSFAVGCNERMRLWASCSSLSFDELAQKIGEVADLSFTLAPSYVGAVDERHGWPISLSGLGKPGIRQIPTFQRTATALTGFLAKTQSNPSRFEIRSVLTASLCCRNNESLSNQLHELLGEQTTVHCQLFGSLGVSSLGYATTPNSVKVRILRFESLCLLANDARFGQWVEVCRYGGQNTVR